MTSLSCEVLASVGVTWESLVAFFPLSHALDPNRPWPYEQSKYGDGLNRLMFADYFFGQVAPGYRDCVKQSNEEP
jgi:hypothetical protein